MTFGAAAPVFVPFLISTSIVTAAFLAPTVLQAGSYPDEQTVTARPWVSLAKVAEHRYQMRGKIRLLLFWVGKDNVGGARMVWYRGSGADRGYELLIGSDPARAPRKVNRWGYISEEHRGLTTTMVGVMQPSDETTLAEAEAQVENHAEAGAAFSLLRETVTMGESVAQVTTAHLSRDYSYRELDSLLGVFTSIAKAPEVSHARVEADVTPGLLTAIATAMHDDAGARRQARNGRGARGRVWRYAFNAKIYRLTLASSEFVGTQEYGGRSYENLVRNEFEITMSGFTWTEKFALVYAADGPEAELPVFIVYQPRWWFKAELQLDDGELF